MRAEIELPAGCTLVSGKAREEAGQLEGRAYKSSGLSFWPDLEPTADRVLVEWIVRGSPGSEIKLQATHERAGTVRAVVRL